VTKRERKIIGVAMQTLARAVDYLETANGIILEDGGDEGDHDDASAIIRDARFDLALVRELVDAK
jgi:hypothetical protein